MGIVLFIVFSVALILVAIWYIVNHKLAYEEKGSFEKSPYGTKTEPLLAEQMRVMTNEEVEKLKRLGQEKAEEIFCRLIKEIEEVAKLGESEIVLGKEACEGVPWRYIRVPLETLLTKNGFTYEHSMIDLYIHW